MFVTAPAIDWLKRHTSENAPNVVIVGRFTPKDFIDGASDLDAIKSSLLAGYKVKALSNLHAKIYQIDNDQIFTGSANMTGKGLSLVEHCNLEACTQVSPSNESKAFIQMIINASVDLTLAKLDKMQVFIDALDSGCLQNIPKIWPEDILPRIMDIFVSDFPVTGPHGQHELYEVNSSLEFSIITANYQNFELAQNYFKNSKAYCWLKKLLIDNKGNRDLSFGQISRLLHDELCDDPAPYRRDIKDLQINLYKYVELYASDEIELYVPGRRSQVLRLVG